MAAKSSINWWKWSIIIAVAVCLFLIGRCNGIRSVGHVNSIDTTIHRDTGTIRYIPVPWKIKDIDSFYIKGEPYSVHDTLENYNDTGSIRYMVVDTGAIIRKYFQTAYYDTTIKLKRGTARLIDTVTMNRITGKSVTVIGADTTIVKKEILVQPKRLIVYTDFSLLGNVNSPVDGIGAGLSLKTTNDMIYGFGIKFIRDKQMLYEGKVSLPIRLKKP